MALKPSTPSRRNAEIYRNAAKLIEAGTERLACLAIAAVSKSYNDKEPIHADFVSYFKPEDATHGEGWFSRMHDYTPESQDHRVVALCLMAAITDRP